MTVTCGEYSRTGLQKTKYITKRQTQEFTDQESAVFDYFKLFILQSLFSFWLLLLYQ